MILCPVCGFRNMDSNDRCFKCSALLKRDEELFRKSAATTARRTRIDRVTRRFTAPFDWLRHQPWFCSISDIPDDGVYRYPFTAGLLSILPGAGHIYAGQAAKGVLVAIVSLILLFVAVLSLLQEWSNVLLFSMLIAWFVVWADAVAVATRRNGDRWRGRKTLALACGAMMIIGVTLIVTQYLGIGFLSLEKVSTGVLEPAVAKDERIMFSPVPLWFRSPRVGEIVMFDPPRFTAEQRKDVYFIDIGKYFQRVLGGPGDSVAKRGAQFFRNGAMIPQTEIPILGDKLPDFDIVVPADSYFIPVTGIPVDALAALVGAGNINHVGQPGFVFPKWPEFAIVHQDNIAAKGVAVLNPPQRRKWLP